MTTPPTTAIDRILNNGPKAIANGKVDMVDPRDRSHQTNAQINASLLEALILAKGGAIHSEAGENHSPRARYDEGMIDTPRGPVEGQQHIRFGLGDQGKINSDAMAQLLAKEIPAMIPSLNVKIDYEARDDLQAFDDTRSIRSRGKPAQEPRPHALTVEIDGADIASSELTTKLMDALGKAIGVNKSVQVR